MLSLDFGIDVPLQRKGSSSSWEDTRSNDWPTVDTIRVAYLLDDPVVVTTENGKQHTQKGHLYVYRGTDIRAGDRVVLPEGAFGVSGSRQLDHNHPMDDTNFGVMRLRIELGG